MTLRLLLLIALAFGGFAATVCADEPAVDARAGTDAAPAPSPNLTWEAAATKFGEELASALNEHQADRVFALFDRGAFADRTLRDLPDESFGLRLRVFDEVRSSLSPMFSAAKHTRFLRLKPVGKEMCALVRLVTPDQGVVYLGFVFRPDEAGSLRWCDVHIYGQGEMFSEIVRWPIAQMAAERDQGIWAAFFGRDQPFTDCVPEIRRARELLDAGSAAKAWAIVEAFPEEVRSQRMLLRLRLRIAEKLSTDRQLAVLAEWERKYPDDLAPALLRLDVDFERKDFSRFAQRLALLQQSVGGDPYLELINAVALIEGEKFDEARATARAMLAQASAPADKAAAFDILLKVALTAKNHPAVAEVLDEVAASFPDLDLAPEVSSSPGYAEFRSSSAYTEWQARRAARLAPDGGVPLSEAECVAFGTQLAGRINRHDWTAICAQLDHEAMINRALHGLRLAPDVVRALKTSFAPEERRKGLFAFASVLGARFVRTQEIAGERRVLLRFLVGDERWSYGALVCGRRPGGTVSWIDTFDCVPGELASVSLRRDVMPLLVESDSAIEKQLSATEREFLGYAPLFAKARELGRQRKHLESLKVLQSLPESLRNEPAVLGLVSAVAAQIGKDEMVAAGEEWAWRHPGSTATALVQMETALLAADYGQVIRSIDTVQDAIGADSYLDFCRARAAWLDGDFDTARAAAARAIEQEPELKVAHHVLWRIEATARDYAALVRALEVYGERFPDDPAPLRIEADRTFERFLFSADYRKWSQRRAERSVSRPE